MQTFLKSPFKLSAFCFMMLTAGSLSAQLQSPTFISADDLTITYPGSGTNNGTTLQTNVTTASTAYKRIALKFNLSSIPSDAIIVSATLSLTIVGTENTNNMVLKRITTTTWSEASATLNPATTTTNQVVTTLASLMGKRAFNVLPLVKDIVSGTAANNGWLISCDPESTVTAGNTYHSNTAATSTDRPVLTVYWYRPFLTNAVTVTNTSSSSTSTGTIAVSVKRGSGNPATCELRNSAGTLITTTTGSLTVVDSITTLPTYISLPHGWYGLKVMGAYDTYYMAFLVGASCEPVTISFAPGPEYVDDAMIYSNVSSNDGNSLINIATYNGGVTGNALIRFRLWMHSGLNPLEAKLTMIGSSHNYANGPNEAKFLLNTGNWSELTVTKDNDPAVSSSVSATLPTTTSSNQNQTIEINNFWNTWKANNFQNYGMSLQYTLSLYDKSQRFHSSDAVSTGNRPAIQFLLDDATCDRTSYTLFKNTLDGGYAVTFQKKLKFYFTEEYQIDPGKKIPLTLLDENSDVVAAIDISGGAVGGKPLLPAFAYVFDDNRYILDLTSYSLTANKYYTLQLTRSNGEKSFIKFKYTN